jgi:hypothetical protein
MHVESVPTDIALQLPDARCDVTLDDIARLMAKDDGRAYVCSLIEAALNDPE